MKTHHPHWPFAYYKYSMPPLKLWVIRSLSLDVSVCVVTKYDPDGNSFIFTMWQWIRSQKVIINLWSKLLWIPKLSRGSLCSISCPEANFSNHSYMEGRMLCLIYTRSLKWLWADHLDLWIVSQPPLTRFIWAPLCGCPSIQYNLFRP